MTKRKLPKIKNYESFPKVNPTVDIACFNASHTYMLFGKKPTDDKLRLIGGFAATTDSCYEDSAIREFKEETNGNLVNVEYICSQLTNDWRFRESDDKVTTILFYGQVLDDRTLKAGDDIAEIHWIEFNELCETNLSDLIIEGHVYLVKRALEHITKNGNRKYATI